MKPSRRTALLVILLFVVIVFAAAFKASEMMETPEIQAKIRTYIEKNAPYGIKTGHIAIRWLPLPHLEIRHIKIESPQFALTAPFTYIYPNWLFMLPGSPPVSEVEVFRPNIKVIAINTEPETELPFDLLPDSLVAHEATIHAHAGIFAPGLLLGDRPTTFKECTLKVILNRKHKDFHISLSGNPGYAQTIEISIELQKEMQRFDGWAKFKHLDLNRLFSHYITNKSVPVADDINVFLSVSSPRPGFYDGSLTADTPCISFQDKNQKGVKLSCGVLTMDLHLTPSDIDASILKCDIKNPHLALSGRIEITRPEDKEEEPEWKIDLDASDVDIAGIRDVVLHLFGKSAEAKEVCNIVRGGRAKKLTYFFRGKTSDFELMDHMKITALVDSAPIYIPDPDLLLDEASGPIVIKDGILYGKNLTARVGKSKGWNGSLELGLSEHLFQFKLALDLEADVTELKPLLERLIDDRDVVNEIKKFHDVKGTAQGSLRIGDDLRDFDVYVKIDDVKAQGFYDRLNWPIKLTSGRAAIAPDSVSWDNVSGYAGRSRIRESSGKIDWKGEPVLDIKTFRADIDSEQFLNHLLTYNALKDDILPVVTGMKGRFFIHSAHLEGPAFVPENWKYSLNASPSSVAVFSPMLPADTSARSGRITFSDRSLVLREFKIDVSGAPLTLYANMRHELLEEWKGKIGFSGTYGKGIDNWVIKNGWSLPAFEFRHPCHIENSSVEFDESEAHFIGTWRFNRGKRDEAYLTIDRYEGSRGFELNRLEISSNKESAIMTLKVPAGAEGISFSWNGMLSADTVGKILSRKDLLLGTVSGDFHVMLGSHPDIKSPAGFGGRLAISGLQWLWGVAKPFYIKNITLIGESKTAHIEEGRFDLSGDILDINGRLDATNMGLNFDIDLGSKFIHQSSIDALFSKSEEEPGKTGNLSEKKRDLEGGSEAEKSKAQGIEVSGKADFSFETLIEVFGRENEKAVSANSTTPLTLKFTDLEGSIRLYKDAAIRTDISSGLICGIEVRGSELKRPGKKKLCSLIFKTPKGKENSFEEVTSCIGSYTDMIQGPFTMDAAVDMNGTTITTGHIDLDAHDGKISRFTMLSRIFSIVNLVDFLGKKGWTELSHKGLAYSVFRFRSIIENDILKIENASVYGNGLNLFAKGNADIDSGTLDLQVVVAPLKTIDAIVTNIPLIGKGFGGEHNAFLTIPVSVKGSIDTPEIKTMPVKTFTDIFEKLVTAPIKGPFKFIQGLGEKDSTGSRPGGRGVPQYSPDGMADR